MFSFDESNEYFRSPLGAVKSGTTLKLRILVERNAEANVQIVYASDGGAESFIDMEWKEVCGKFDVFEGYANFDVPDLYWYHFKINSTRGNYNVDRNGLTSYAYSPFQLTVYKESTNSWFPGGIMYQIFVDRFNRGTGKYKLRPGAVYRDDWDGIPTYKPNEDGIVMNNDFFGGTLRGVIEKLPYLQECGVTCIYLNPVFEAASNHKYDTADYMSIDKSFGDDKTFQELCDIAQSKGMRVICDGVFNHCGVDSIYFNKYDNYDSIGAYQSQTSKYTDWFTFYRWNQEYRSWWGIDLLPSFNTGNKEYREYITGEKGVLAHWLKKGCSGYRLDVVDELPDEFLYPLCKAVKKAKSDALIIGEVWEDASNKIAYDRRRKYFIGGQLDSVMNYPLKDAIISFVKNGNVSIIADTMAALVNNYPKNVLDCLMNILGTHDTARILTVLGCDYLPDNKDAMASLKMSKEQVKIGRKRLKIASALQYTLPGVPCVYYGDEVGMKGCADPFNRMCYPWGKEDKGLLKWYKLLSKIRKRHSAFRDGRYELIQARDGVYAFSRGDGGEKVIIAANISNESKRLSMLDGNLYDCINDKIIAECVVPALSVGVFGV